MKNLFVLILFLFPCFCIAQDQVDGENPFDLEWRKPKVGIDKGGENTGTGNPFDVVPHRVPQSSGISIDRTTSDTSGFWNLERFGKESKSFLVWIAFLYLTILAVVVSLSRGSISKAWNAFISNNQFALLFRDWANRQLLLPFLILYGNFILNISLFVYLSLKFIKGNEIGGIRLLLLCLLFVGLFFALKHLVVWIVGQIYPVQENASKYIFLMASANISIGLFLVPFNLLISFVASLQGFLIFWVMSLIAIFYLLRIFRAFSFGGKVILGDKFHFLLYLCAVEILPILLIAKVIWTKII